MPQGAIFGNYPRRSIAQKSSLPSRSAKGTDLPAFGSSSLRNKDSVSNGSHTNSPRFTLSRFSSSTSSHWIEELKIDNNLSDRTGVLSSEFQQLGSEETSSFQKSDNALSENNLTKGVDSLEDSSGNGQFQFHFSIYKWASKGVPLMMPLRGGNGSRLREKTLLRRSSSSSDRVVKEKNEMKSPTSTIQNIDFPPIFREMTNVEDEKGTDLLPDMNAVDQRKAGRGYDQPISAAPSENLSRQSSRKAEKNMTSISNEDRKFESKSLSSFLIYNDGDQSEEGISEAYRKGETVAKSDKKPSFFSDLSSSLKKQDKQTSLRHSKVKKSSSINSDMESIQNINRKNVGGKISEFVKIFNQEPASKPQDVVDFENDSPTRKQESASKAQTKATVNKISKDEKSKLSKNTDASIKVDDVSKQSVDDHSAKTAASFISSSISSKEGRSAPNTVHVPNDSKYTVPDVEDPFQDNFSVKELPQDYDSRETDNNREEFQAIDTKIRHWSNGKEGNIRSLLSTLQYVLWPKSGWKPVPLVDIIEGNAVKRSYQKALLYLHPDKLQQKGASSDQKYIAAKVFEILQEAWAHFNTLSGL